MFFFQCRFIITILLARSAIASVYCFDEIRPQGQPHRGLKQLYLDRSKCPLFELYIKNYFSVITELKLNNAALWVIDKINNIMYN